MSALRRFLFRLRNAIAPGRAERELTREVSAHLAVVEDEYRRRGLTPEEAAIAARRALGGVEFAKDQQRDARSFLWADNLRRDVAYAIRILVRSPGTSVVAILTLALAIGACTAIFTVVDRVLWRSLPMPNANRLVRLYESNAKANRVHEDVSIRNVADWRLRAKTLDTIAAIGGTSFTMTGAKEPELLVGMLVSPEFFQISGAKLELGQPFDSSEYSSSANAALGPIVAREPVTGSAAIIIGHDLWVRQFDRDPAVIGRHVRLNDADAIVKGVMPPGMWLDTTAWGVAEVWLPVNESRQPNRRVRLFTAVGRLAPGATVDAAQAEFRSIAASLAQEFPKDNTDWTIDLSPLKDTVTKQAQPTLLILFGGVTCVLLIACANIANLLLMRAAGRSREVAIRMAIGAGRGRLVSQWLTESTVLAVAGGIGGFLIALWAVPVLVSFSPAALPRLNEISVDTRIFLFSVLVSLVTGLLCGLAPALAARRVTVAALRTSAAPASAPRRRFLRPGLLVLQIGLSIVLLVVAGLMGRTLLAVSRLDLGFDPERVLTFDVRATNSPRYRDLDVYRRFSSDLTSAFEQMPGVQAAAVGGIPLQTSFTLSFFADGSAESIETLGNVPSSHYFRTLGMRFLSGREFNEQDTRQSERVIIVTRAFALRAWGSEDVVGRQLRIDYKDAPPVTVIGVVNDIRIAGLEKPPAPLVFIPMSQTTIATMSSYVVRTSGPPRDALPFVREVVKRLDPSLAVSRIATMEERLSKAIAPRRFNLWLMALFASVAMVLAVVGIYGLINESVASRTPEIGVRMALGARSAQIVRLVGAGTLVITAIGLVLGLATSAAVTRWLGSMLFGVEPLDPFTLVVVPIVFAAVAALAAVSPARRATRVDPVIALRGE